MMKRIISGMIASILTTGTFACVNPVQSGTFLTTSSPNETYTVEFQGNKYAPTIPFVDHETRFNLFKEGQYIVKGGYVDQYDWFDSDFAGMYPEYRWVTESALRIGKDISYSEKSTDSLIVVNKTSRSIRYLRIVAGDMLFIFEMPPNSKSWFPVPFLGELPWVTGEGDFSDNQKIKWDGVNFQNKDKLKHSLRYCISVENESVRIESPIMGGYNVNGTNERPNVQKAESCDL